MSDTPRTDAETMRDEYDHVDTEFGPFAPSVTVGVDFARQLERELAEVTRQRDELAEALEVAMARAYAAGYQHGHDDSVEVRFITVDQSEAKEHFAEDVKQMLLDGSQPAAALAAVKGGGE